MRRLYLLLYELPQKQRVALSFFVSMLCLGAWYWFQIKPTHERIDAERRLSQQLSRKLNQSSTVKRRIERLNKDIRAAKEREARLRRRLPEQANIRQLLRKLHERANSSRLTAERLELGETVIEELYARIEIKMSFTGSFKNILMFLNELSDIKGLDRIVNVEQLSLNRESSTFDETLKGSCLLVTFMAKSAAGAVIQ
ncbi:MAG: type 4a pilus biogenesis protein PilO [Myxococcota bacterium]|nr:type 4a pilus biogenesis protein PilO [Myxococcota bacterium]